jgi:hypothetical protein
MRLRTGFLVVLGAIILMVLLWVSDSSMVLRQKVSSCRSFSTILSGAVLWDGTAAETVKRRAILAWI